MRTIDDYLDAAIKAQNLPSDRQLALHLKINPSAISQMRTKRIWPGDETMGLIAISGGHDPEIALLELNAWRTSGSTRTCYQKMAAKLASIAAMLLILVGISTSAKAEQVRNMVTLKASPMYIMENKMLFFIINRIAHHSKTYHQFFRPR